MPAFFYPLLRPDISINVSTLCREQKTQHILQFVVFIFAVVAILGSMKSNPAYVTAFGILAAFVALLAALFANIKPGQPEGVGLEESNITVACQHQDNDAALQGASEGPHSSCAMDASGTHSYPPSASSFAILTDQYQSEAVQKRPTSGTSSSSPVSSPAADVQTDILILPCPNGYRKVQGGMRNHDSLVYYTRDPLVILHQCTIYGCSDTFLANEIEDHLERKHPRIATQSTVTCKDCEYTTQGKYYEEHFLEVHSGRSFLCAYCGDKQSRIRMLRRHFERCPGLAKYLNKQKTA